MERIVSKRYKTLKYLLFVNILFWLIIGGMAMLRYVLLDQAMPMMLLLIASTLVLYSLGFWLIHKRRAYSKLLVFLLSFGVAMMSLLDEFGLVDFLSFLLSILVVITVISLWMAEKRKESIRRRAVED